MSELTMPSKSTSAHPDLDWSQVKETVLMLKLAAAQVEFSLRDGNNSVDVLADSFTSMAGGITAIEKSFKELKATHDINEDVSSSIVDLCEDVSGKMQHAIMAFQFYDTLVQRLDHVVGSLSQLGDLVGDASTLYSPLAWQALQEKIRSKYSMKQERELFDALMNGEDMESVLKKLHEITEKTVENDDIELF
jgi:hypothetical protein